MNNHINQDFASSDRNQDFEQVLVPAIYRYLQTEDYQKAIENLNDFCLKSDRDENSSLKHKCDSWRALIFEKQGKYWEALSLYKSLAQIIGKEHTLFAYLQVDVARVLHKLGDTKSAMLEIEKTFESPMDALTSDKLTALNLYVDLLKEDRNTLPAKYQSLVKHLVENLGIELRENDWLAPSHLNHSVKELFQKNREANRRYSQMLIELDKMDDDDQAKGILREYISEERVGYYRNLAIKELDELEE